MLSTRPRLVGTLVGLVVTAVVTYLSFSTAALRRAELQSIDTRLKHWNTLAPQSPIVHIDIDDHSLDRVGRWPWHRDVTGDLVRVLSELGAKYVLIDLLFTEPEQPYVDPELLLGQGTDAVVGELSAENLIEPDLEFADAIGDAGNVIMAVHLDMRPSDAPAPLRDRLRELSKSAPHLDAASAMSQLGLESTAEQRKAVERELLRLRIRQVLREKFTLTHREVAEKLGAEIPEISGVFAGVKRDTAEELVGGLLRGAPEMPLDKALEALLGKESSIHSADAADVMAAYRVARGIATLKTRTFPLDDRFLRIERASSITPLDYRFAGAALDIGVVNFRSDPDGVVRRVPLLVDSPVGAIQHMGLAGAGHILNLDVKEVRSPDRWNLEIPSRGGDGPLRLPLDGEGNLLIHWAATAADWRRGLDFPHVPAVRLTDIAMLRRDIRRNDRMKRLLLADVVKAAKGEFTRIVGEGANAKEIREPGDAAYIALVNRQLELLRIIRRSEMAGGTMPAGIDDIRREAAALAGEIEKEERAAIEEVEFQWSQLASFKPDEIENDPELKRHSDRFANAHRIISEKLPALDRANAALTVSIESLKKELTPLIKDKYAFIGFAATAEGDIVSTPIDPQTNGVMCHAHVLNSILQYSFIRLLPPWVGVVASLFLGAVTGLMTATRGPAASLLVTILLIFGFAFVVLYVLFQVNHILFPFVPCLLTIFCSWAFVTLFRQLTAERDKRHFRKQLSQYTSPAIAAKIAESPEAAKAFKAVQTRDMTCIFTDLKGFTTITEQEDAEVVQHVLNVYLERMSQVIWAHRGMINKFMGDGIMAIFNPSVDPLPEHPQAACEAALHAMEELENLKRERLAGGGAPMFSKLEMRLGLATGNCKNGDLGSELKADYTVIGDVVNLAARLEPANKVFGTSILVSGPLHDRVKDAYEFRYLAELQVKGKAKTVPVFEVLGKKGAVAAGVLEFARRFEAGVELYKTRKWDECIVHFTRILSRRPDDAGASRYIEACQEMKTFPPGAEWGGALELKEK